MSDPIKKERSPNFPKFSLAFGIEQTKKLYDKAGKAKISAESAVVALGYSGLNGAALGTLGALNSYGLIDRERGESISVSPSAIKLLHPLDRAQEDAVKVELALKLKVFADLYAEGFLKVDQKVLANQLVQKGFTADGADKAATVYLENFEFAKLQDGSNVTKSELPKDKNKKKPEHDEPPDDTFTVDRPGAKMLAKYSIPLGANEATLVFTGVEGQLSPDDFDALSEYVALFKKQLQRKSKATPIRAANSGPVSFPAKAVWHNKDTDKPVTIVRFMGKGNGHDYYESEDGTGILASELKFS